MFCLYCGVPNPDDALFCRSCGRRQYVEESDSATNVTILPGLPFPETAIPGGQPPVANVPMVPGTPSIPDSPPEQSFAHSTSNAASSAAASSAPPHNTSLAPQIPPPHTERQPHPAPYSQQYHHNHTPTSFVNRETINHSRWLFKGGIIKLVGLTLLIIVSGTGILYAIRSNQIVTPRASSSTVTATATATTQTIFVNATTGTQITPTASPQASSSIKILGGASSWSGYCQSIGNSSASLDGNTAYDWHCITSGGQRVALSVMDLCKWQYHDPQAIDRLADYNNPNSGWECWG